MSSRRLLEIIGQRSGKLSPLLKDSLSFFMPEQQHIHNAFIQYELLESMWFSYSGL